jgi:hypothetical protein
MPNILTTVNAKADMSVYGMSNTLLYLICSLSSSEDDGDEVTAEREGLETVTVDGRTMGIKTSALEEKCQAFETLLIYCSMLGGKYAPYLSQALEICIPHLEFDFCEGVHEASAMYVWGGLSILVTQVPYSLARPSSVARVVIPCPHKWSL